jgi:hypothetical protein
MHETLYFSVSVGGHLLFAVQTKPVNISPVEMSQ